ncbi:MAG: hypothetical protein IT200_12590 [Thermoleophilia bacterium]|nr:hypothetical protein [Thermoleophilia bacterium]
MPRRLVQLILAITLALLAVPVLAAAQGGGPDLPPVPDSAPAPAATPDPLPATPSPAPAPRHLPSSTPRPAPAATGPTGPTAAQVAAARAAARAKARREAAARRARERRAAVARRERRQAALLRRRSQTVRDATASGVDAVDQQVANLVEAVRARPAPAQAVGDGIGPGGGTTILAGLALLGAAGIGGLAFVRRRTGGRRFSPRLAITSIVAIDRRQVGVLIAAAFVVGAAAAAAILAYLIVNPSAVG